MHAFPVVDTHLHVWNPQALRYPWLDNNPLLNKSFLLNDYNQATAGLSVDKMVFVQCECIFSQCEEEAGWVTQLATADPRIQGIVPLAPLEEEDVEEMLERYSTNPLIKGIRRIIQFESDPGFCLHASFVAGVKKLSQFNYSFDICINHSQLPQTIKLVSLCPDVQFILDHIGKPDIKNQQLDPWRKHIRELASFPNVYCKISGLVTEADFEQWQFSDLTPYLDHVLNCFGIDRLIWGGDWPVVLQAATLQKWMDTTDQFFSQLRKEEQEKLYHGNAVRFYRL